TCALPIYERAPRCLHREAAVAAAAADRLREDAVGPVARGADQGIHRRRDAADDDRPFPGGHGDRVAVAAGTAGTADRRAGEQRPADRVGAVAAAAADRLRKDAVGIPSGGGQVAAGRDLHRGRRPAGGAVPADVDELAAGRTAVATAAADRLGLDRARVRAPRDDAARVLDLHGFPVTARGAGAAQGHQRFAGPARAAAAAHALGENAAGEVAGRDQAARIVDGYLAGGAAAAARAAEGDQAGGRAAAAAAATDALGENRIRTVALRADETAVDDLHGAAVTATAAAAAPGERPAGAAGRAAAAADRLREQPARAEARRRDLRGARDGDRTARAAAPAGVPHGDEAARGSAEAAAAADGLRQHTVSARAARRDRAAGVVRDRHRRAVAPAGAAPAAGR